MIRILGTIFAGLFGVAFGSFLNVCLSRWPAGESIVSPRSHCRQCNRTLAWWENVPLVSWLALRGRCRTCHAWIGWRYPLVELAVGGLWSTFIWHISEQFEVADIANQLRIVPPHIGIIPLIGTLGIAFSVLSVSILQMPLREQSEFWIRLGERLLETLAAAALILLIRWLYWLIRRREGIGLGDAKLMALLAAWLGLPGALLSFGLGVVLGALVAVALLLIPSARRSSEGWAASKLPLGTFLCIGGIVSSLWGEPILIAYYRWPGF